MLEVYEVSQCHTRPGHGGGHSGDWERIENALKCVFKSDVRGGFVQSTLYVYGHIIINPLCTVNIF
jgi:hypothetical protein